MLSISKRFGWSLAILSTLSCGLACQAGSRAQIEVAVDKPGAELSPVLYGLFFEDINYAADGGLYAELVQNRSFEYYPVDGWGRDSHRLRPLTSWSKVEADGGAVELKVVDDQPLNDRNTKYLVMSITGDGVAGVRNEGFAGIRVEKGKTYDFSVYARRGSGESAPLRVTLTSTDGSVVAEGATESLTGEWAKHELTLTAGADAANASLSVTTTGGGDVMLDVVSLFPRDTFKGRKNGLRKDLAQALADLKPGFLRFPGGCIAHGHGLANTYRWKDTVGDVAQRKPNWNLWGYHQTYGLGYFEYFQLCEDIGASPLPVLPVGVSCGFRRPFDIVPMDELHVWIDDALDLIEFAIGPADSEWGKVRAEMGHPEPFAMEYVCLGNEEHDTPEVRERLPFFVKAIRQRYPDIKIIGTSGLGPEIPLFDLMEEMDVYSTDEHYYMPPKWYLDNTGRFDSFDRQAPKVFVGEYASEGNTLHNAVAEAAYLTGIERNADIVDMACYAPLFAKYDYTQWTRADLIWFDNQQLVLTPNYYVQQFFSVHKGDVACLSTVDMSHGDRAKTSYAGAVGLGSWRTAIEARNAELNGQPLDVAGWEPTGGDFSADAGKLSQADAGAEGCVAISSQSGEGDSIVYSIQARKNEGAEGFLVVFGDRGDGSRYWWNVGGWGNSRHGIERRVDGNSVEQLISTRGSIDSERWYDLRVELTPGRIRCFIDDKLIHDYVEPEPQVFVSSTIDESQGELILKIVNPQDEPVAADITLSGAGTLASEGTLTGISGSAGAVNTRESQPIKPTTSRVSVGEQMGLELPRNSVQVLRVKLR